MISFLRSVKKLTLIILGIILVALLAYVWWLRRPEYKIDSSRDAVIIQIRELSRLETASYRIEKIIEAGTSGNAIKEFLFGDRLLLIANGEVIAGIDLSKMEEEDIVIDGKTIEVNLPAPEILVSRLDNEKTRVYDRDRGVLNISDKDLETEARNEAEQSIRRAACEGGIMQEASDNARVQLTSLLKAFEFETVIVNIPSGNCL